MLKQTPTLPADLADEDAKFIVNQLCFCMPGLIKVIAPCISEDFRQASITLLCSACVKSNVSCSAVATKHCSHIFQMAIIHGILKECGYTADVGNMAKHAWR